ncbi:hypothetical protein R2F25_30355 [Streptomyces sp. UP1A-1]|nr:hypothetical protein [Streptomyces sp. UP1A-1]
MRIRITLDIRTTPRRAHTPRPTTTPPTDQTPPTPDTTPTTEANTPDTSAPFGFTLDGTSLSSDTERAEPYDDGRDADYDDEHGDQQQ